TLSILDDGQRQSLMDILDRLRAGGTQIAFDSNYRPVGWPRIADARKWMSEAFRRCDIALPTLDDEQRLFGDIDADACLARLRGAAARTGRARNRLETRRRRLRDLHRGSGDVAGRSPEGRQNRRYDGCRGFIQRRLSLWAAHGERPCHRRRYRQPTRRD